MAIRLSLVSGDNRRYAVGTMAVGCFWTCRDGVLLCGLDFHLPANDLVLYQAAGGSSSSGNPTLTPVVKGSGLLLSLHKLRFNRPSKSL